MDGRPQRPARVMETNDGTEWPEADIVDGTFAAEIAVDMVSCATRENDWKPMKPLPRKAVRSSSGYGRTHERK